MLGSCSEVVRSLCPSPKAENLIHLVSHKAKVQGPCKGEGGRQNVGYNSASVGSHQDFGYVYYSTANSDKQVVDRTWTYRSYDRVSSALSCYPQRRTIPLNGDKAWEELSTLGSPGSASRVGRSIYKQTHVAQSVISTARFGLFHSIATTSEVSKNVGSPSSLSGPESLRFEAPGLQKRPSNQSMKWPSC